MKPKTTYKALKFILSLALVYVVIVIINSYAQNDPFDRPNQKITQQLLQRFSKMDSLKQLVSVRRTGSLMLFEKSKIVRKQGTDTLLLDIHIRDGEFCHFPIDTLIQKSDVSYLQLGKLTEFIDL